MMKITVLAENTSVSESLIAEHGLSLYIETESKKILFDMGQTDAFAKNAENLGIDLTKVDFAVLSHGHYDHGGGLRTFLSVNENAPVYLSRHAFGDYYSSKYIGLDKTLAEEHRLRYVSDYLKIDEEIELFSCNDRTPAYKAEFYGLTAERDGVRTDDDFCHEQYLVITEKGKRVVISGCSHKGVLNAVHWLEPDVFVGGFHFIKLEPDGEGREILDRSAEILSSKNIPYYTCHCTGEKQYEYLKTRISQLHYISCGMQIEILKTD